MKPFYSFTILGLFAATAHGATLITTGQTVGGASPISVDPTTGVAGGGGPGSPNIASTSTAGGNLAITFSTTPANNDFYVTWSGITIPTATHTFVQIDFLAASSGAVDGPLSIFWADSDSGIGGPNNSSTGLGTGTVSTSGSYSVVIDLNDGGTNTSGATGWGGGNATAFRLDLFELPANNGETFTISGVTFGQALVPEPSVFGLFGLGGAIALIRRRR
ncbi:PEP-CTERM sorting domain-containing protein [Akkermansiaceae bacterium]|nr:PEP-CTERM sorting domain-containing protein [Akkermansiaceae bacterium]